MLSSPNILLDVYSSREAVLGDNSFHSPTLSVPSHEADYSSNVTRVPRLQVMQQFRRLCLVDAGNSCLLPVLRVAQLFSSRYFSVFMTYSIPCPVKI